MLFFWILFAACGGTDDTKVPDDTATPAGHEFCDGIDNDGDGLIDETFDLDGDGWLADEADCRAMGVQTDCDDLDPDIHPGVEEVCDGLDNDCSGIVDDALDGDGDGSNTCEDCDDANADVYPGAAEVCDGVDNDCSGLADEAWDDDGDLVSECGGDCNDRDPKASPLLPEVCDGQDNNCDGVADEGFDQDADGYTTCEGDCDDTNVAINPSGVEACNGLDDDCDGVVLETTDVDGDGYTICAGDCGEENAQIHPGATESCNSRDDDCDGEVDSLSCYGCTEEAPYLYCTKRYNWEDAEGVCEMYGATLAILHDADENALVGSRLLTYVSTGNAWIGASDEVVEGTWVWLDDTAMDYTAWDAGQPSSGSSEDCLGQSHNGLAGMWYAKRCTTTQPFVCETP